MESDDFPIEKIVDYSKYEGEQYFLVKWEGFDDSANTWEPLSSFNSMDLITEFLKERQIKEGKSKVRNQKMSKKIFSRIKPLSDSESDVEMSIPASTEEEGKTTEDGNNSMIQKRKTKSEAGCSKEKVSSFKSGFEKQGLKRKRANDEKESEKERSESKDGCDEETPTKKRRSEKKVTFGKESQVNKRLCGSRDANDTWSQVKKGHSGSKNPCKTDSRVNKSNCKIEVPCVKENPISRSYPENKGSHSNNIELIKGHGSKENSYDKASQVNKRRTDHKDIHRKESQERNSESNKALVTQKHKQKNKVAGNIAGLVNKRHSGSNDACSKEGQVNKKPSETENTGIKARQANTKRPDKDTVLSSGSQAQEAFSNFKASSAFQNLHSKMKISNSDSSSSQITNKLFENKEKRLSFDEALMEPYSVQIKKKKRSSLEGSVNKKRCHGSSNLVTSPVEYNNLKVKICPKNKLMEPSEGKLGASSSLAAGEASGKCELNSYSPVIPNVTVVSVQNPSLEQSRDPEISEDRGLGEPCVPAAVESKLPDRPLEPIGSLHAPPKQNECYYRSQNHLPPRLKSPVDKKSNRSQGMPPRSKSPVDKKLDRSRDMLQRPKSPVDKKADLSRDSPPGPKSPVDKKVDRSQVVSPRLKSPVYKMSDRSGVVSQRPKSLADKKSDRSQDVSPRLNSSGDKISDRSQDASHRLKLPVDPMSDRSQDVPPRLKSAAEKKSDRFRDVPPRLKPPVDKKSDRSQDVSPRLNSPVDKISDRSQDSSHRLKLPVDPMSDRSQDVPARTELPFHKKSDRSQNVPPGLKPAVDKKTDRLHASFKPNLLETRSFEQCKDWPLSPIEPDCKNHDQQVSTPGVKSPRRLLVEPLKIKLISANKTCTPDTSNRSQDLISELVMDADPTDCGKGRKFNGPKFSFGNPFDKKHLHRKKNKSGKLNYEIIPRAEEVHGKYKFDLGLNKKSSVSSGSQPVANAPPSGEEENTVVKDGLNAEETTDLATKGSDDPLREDPVTDPSAKGSVTEGERKDGPEPPLLDPLSKTPAKVCKETEESGIAPRAAIEEPFKHSSQDGSDTQVLTTEDKSESAGVSNQSFPSLDPKYLLGFDFSREPEEIVQAAKLDDGEIRFLVKWKGVDEGNIIFAKAAILLCPDLVIQYYEANCEPVKTLVSEFNERPVSESSDSDIEFVSDQPSPILV